MTTNNEVGKVRQSAVITNYGPGAIADFRVQDTGAAVSIVAAGLEQWVQQAEAAGVETQDMKRLTERRLSDKLKVQYFRLPPIAPDRKKGKNDNDETTIPLIGVRFPKWLQCSTCRTIKPADKWGSTPGDPSKFCNKCSTGRPGNQKYFVVPVRFVVACRQGHLDDFPWDEWIHDGSSCPNKKEFNIEAKGPGLAGLILSCPKCKKKKSMEHVFSKDAHKGSKCTGSRPWLANGDEKCEEIPRTMQRGASNLYFPQTESALIIPPWSEEIIRQLGYRWSQIETITTQEQRKQYVEIFWKDISQDVRNIDMVTFLDIVEEKVRYAGNASSGNLRWDEYQQFMIASGRARKLGDEFDIRKEDVPANVPHIGRLVRVVALRELRAIRSFTRIEPPPGNPPVKRQYLSKCPLNWLPAVEVRGEGIFLSIDKERLGKWEENTAVLERAGQIHKYGESRILNPDNIDPITIDQRTGARFLLIHAIAHILMKQLSLQCGYSTASLRERIYVGTGDQNMAGLMIYTSTSDSDGTLGGLQRQGRGRRFAETFLEAIRSNEWCSSDPLCIGGRLSATESSSLASCHSCMLAPETSCEEYNRFLDRAMLVGTPENRSIGFLSDLPV